MASTGSDDKYGRPRGSMVGRIPVNQAENEAFLKSRGLFVPTGPSAEAIENTAAKYDAAKTMLEMSNGKRGGKSKRKRPKRKTKRRK